MPHASRGRGIGGELLGRAEDSARAAGAHSIWLHVDAENSAAIRLYEATATRARAGKSTTTRATAPAFVYAKPLSPAVPAFLVPTSESRLIYALGPCRYCH